MKRKNIYYIVTVAFVFFLTMIICKQYEMNITRSSGISTATSFLTISILIVYNSVQYNRRLNKVQDILIKEHNSDKFFKETKKLLNETENTSYQAMISIMISNGYSSINNFQAAYDTLKNIEIDNVHLVETSKQQYYLNLIYFCYVLKKYDEGNKIFEKEQKIIVRAKNNLELKSFATMVDVYHLITEKKYLEAKAEIRRVKSITNDKALIRDLDSLGMMIIERNK